MHTMSSKTWRRFFALFLSRTCNCSDHSPENTIDKLLLRSERCAASTVEKSFRLTRVALACSLLRLRLISIRSSLERALRLPYFSLDFFGACLSDPTNLRGVEFESSGSLHLEDLGPHYRKESRKAEGLPLRWTIEAIRSARSPWCWIMVPSPRGPSYSRN